LFGRGGFEGVMAFWNWWRAKLTPPLSQDAADHLREMERRNAEADRRDLEELARIVAEICEARERLAAVRPPEDTRLERVPYDDLDFPDWDHGYTHNGESFTGIAYELYPDSQLRCEVEFRSGSGTRTASSHSTATTNPASASAAGDGTRGVSSLRSSPSGRGT
jgi:hypothetical protein